MRSTKKLTICLTPPSDSFLAAESRRLGIEKERLALFLILRGVMHLMKKDNTKAVLIFVTLVS